MDTEEIDYRALCDGLIKENEKIRIRIIKLENDEYSFIDRLKEKIASIVEDERFLLYFYIAMALFSIVIVPLVKALFAYIIRKRANNEG